MMIKAGKIREKLDGLTTLMGYTLPIQLSYAIGANVDILGKEYDRIEKERIKLCDRYCERDNEGNAIIDGNSYKFAEGTKAEFAMELNNLMDMELDIPIVMVPVSALKLCDNDRYSVLTVKEIYILTCMIKQEINISE